MIKKFKLSNFAAVMILLAADLGIGYFTLPYTFSKDYLWGSILLLFNCLSGLFSCYLYIKTCELTKLQSIQEFAYLLGGGRAALIFICQAFIVYYTFITLFFMNQSHLCLDLLVDKALMKMGYDIGGWDSKAMVMDIIITLTVGVILYPFCIIKEFHRIRIMGILICISNMAILIIVLLYLALFGVHWYTPSSNPTQDDNNFLSTTSIFNHAPDFCFTFHFQIYFLIVQQYLEHRQKVKHSYVVAAATNVTILLFCGGYIVACLATNIVFKDFREPIIKAFDVEANQIIANVTLLIISALQIPFKFFLQKEFLFIMYDELKNKSVSKKVQDYIRMITSHNQSIKRISNQEYKIVREPYLKLSLKEYLTLTTLLFLLNLLLLYFFRTQYLRTTMHHPTTTQHQQHLITSNNNNLLLPPDYYNTKYPTTVYAAPAHQPQILQQQQESLLIRSGDVIVYASSVTGAILQPLVVYVASGYFYYQASLRLDVNPKMRKAAYGFQLLGWVLCIVYTTINVFNILTQQAERQ